MQPDSTLPEFAPGHLMHPIQARLLAETPWGWRPAVVSHVDGLRARASYVLDGAGVVAFWHEQRIHMEWLEVGLPVRVHEQHHALEVDDAWLNIRVDSGIGPVPAPEHPELWAGEAYGVVLNAATGQGIRIDPELLRRFGPRPGTAE
jgi:hypothetical protein